MYDPITAHDRNLHLKTCLHCRSTFWSQDAAPAVVAAAGAPGGLKPNPVTARDLTRPTCSCKECAAKIDASYELPSLL